MSDSESSDYDNQISNVQPIYMSINLGDDFGTKVISGTTASDASVLACEFVKKWKLTENWSELI